MAKLFWGQKTQVLTWADTATSWPLDANTNPPKKNQTDHICEASNSLILKIQTF